MLRKPRGLQGKVHGTMRAPKSSDKKMGCNYGAGASVGKDQWLSRDSSTDASRVLDADLVAGEWRGQHHVEWEGDVHKAHDNANGVADDLHLLDVALWDAQDRRDLLPANAIVRHENAHGEDVEDGPQRVLEDLELQGVDVADTDRLDAGVIGPEEVQRQDAPEVDQVRRRAHVVGSELLSVAEAE